MHEELLCLEDEPRQEADRGRQVWALGEVLAEVLAQYQARYPELKLILAESAPVAAS